MNYPMALVIASALIAGAMFFSNQNDIDTAGIGEWAGIGADSQGKAWVINTSTGKMKTCWYGKSDGNWTVLCGWED